MIHSLSLKNTTKHSRKTFLFTEGLNLIQGQNEAGKSLIFEYIDFALHGSQALRLAVSSYSPNMVITLVVTINGTKYQIERSTKKATIRVYGGQELLATGTKPVDAEIKKILGYSRNVFLVSNYSSQDSINYLSSLKPAERKKTIDNVVGLTAVEEVIADHKAELTTLNRVMSSVKNREVFKPDEVENPYQDKDLDDLIDKYQRKSQQISLDIGVQQNISIQHESLERTKPEPMEKPLTGYYIEGLTEQIIAETRSKIEGLKAKHTSLNRSLLNLVEPNAIREPDLSKIIPDLTVNLIEQRKAESNQRVITISKLRNQLEELPELKEKSSDKFIQEIQAKEKLYQDWLSAQELIKKGSVDCPECGSNVLIAQDLLSKHYSHVPDHVDKVEGLSATLLKKNDQIDLLQKQYSDLNSEIEKVSAAEKVFQETWYSSQQLEDHIREKSIKVDHERYLYEINKYNQDKKDLKETIHSVVLELESFDNWYTDYEIDQHRLAEKKLIEYSRYEANLSQWLKTKEAVQPFVGEEVLAQWRTNVDDLNNSIQEFKSIKSQLDVYKTKLVEYENWLKESEEVNADITSEKLQLETLTKYKQKIKTSILPSVNAVATQWMKKMSLGLHQKVELTDEMEILVNGEPIEALSISGRALGHLSLRMALGQVLTNHVFPVFMADEVDASMRDERGQQVIDALYEMLSGSMKQIIMISHRKLITERVNNLIEV